MCKYQKEMNREEQFAVLHDLFTWQEPVNHYKLAFYAHYELLDDLLHNCAMMFKQLVYQELTILSIQ